MKRFMLWAIRVYQKKLSPLKPPTCRFIPSCSTYALEAISCHGAWRGFWLMLWRLIRCHPFHRDKYMRYDPVPEKEGKQI